MMTFVSKVQSQGMIILGWYLPKNVGAEHITIHLQGIFLKLN